MTFENKLVAVLNSDITRKLGKDTFLAYQASERGGILQVVIQGNRVLLKGGAVTVMAGNWLIGTNP